MINVKAQGDYKDTLSWLTGLSEGDAFSDLDRYGRIGVEALSLATPHETGLTARSWGYGIVKEDDRISIQWYNMNENDGVIIAILIQYGHGTGTGGYISGQDFINPAIQPVFDWIADDVWNQVNNG